MSEGQSARQLESLEEGERSRLWWSALPTNVPDLLSSVKDSGQMVPPGPEPSVDPKAQIILSLLSSASPPQSKANLNIHQRFLPILETLEFSEAVLRPHVTRHGVDSFNTLYGPCSLVFSNSILMMRQFLLRCGETGELNNFLRPQSTEEARTFSK